MTEKRRELWVGVLAGTAVGAAMGIAGFVLANYPATQGMGFALFFTVPAAAGFAIGMVTRGLKVAMTAAIPALAVSLLLLLAGGKEGPICAVLALPLILVPLLIGASIGAFINHRRASRGQGGGTVAVLVLPLVILGAHWAERPMLEQVRIETVTTSVRVPAAPEKVWAMIENIDSIHGPKPWLMYVGLPVPVRCTLERGEVGAKRVCYFEDGTIEERVTEWAPPNRMRLRIEHTHMGIHHWMGFQDAVYELRPDGDGTILTRTTTLESALFPAWYWRPWERLGVGQEHRYILEDVVLRAQSTMPQPAGK
jgi:polyketide cyclase/dehydrase/lipid transport protein